MTTDVHDPQTRSYNMSRIRGKNTKPEVKLRSLLHRAGLRFRLHDSRLPGKPDIVLPRYKAAIFVNGCFWHGHDCRNTKPEQNKEFWAKKRERNLKRDQEVTEILTRKGWKVVRIWECEIAKSGYLSNLSHILFPQ